MSESKPSLHRSPAGTFTRLAKAPADEVVRYSYARVWPLHKALFPGDIAVNLAWVTMLAEQQIIAKPDAVKVLAVLRDLESEGADVFPFDPSSGDFYFNLQARVIDRAGPVGGHIYTGRSRADGEPSALRIFLRNRLLDTSDALYKLADVCMRQAERHTETVMPGFTGSQPAQPWTLGHYLLSFIDAFARDFERVRSSYARVNKSLMGVGVGAGSDLHFDRLRVADLLGFDGYVENSREWVTSYDAVAEAVSTWSIQFAHLSQMASDLHMWCTQQFGLIEFGDEFSGSSSFMPQKKNPTPLHMIRALASTSLGQMPAVLGLIKTSSQDFDTMLINLPTITVAGEAIDSTDYLAAALETLQPHVEVMHDQAVEMWTTASELPTLIVRERGLDWRSAHWIVERLVRSAIERGVGPRGVTGSMIDEAAEAIVGGPLGITDSQVQDALDPRRFIETRVSIGSVNPDESRRMLGERRGEWASNKSWTDDQRTHLKSARRALDAAGADLAQ